ncbi:unnamed protein product [Fraxinus pennsylvanica]|uniref:RNase H type-1 domain-containing protein n=1 Tax=Fraxinus pennsylvanica TaxID=56036 RepID=A0AAD1Z0W2_9LAMI|nr:unnamed protein product [Fraxinus pennsylvanica]
MGPAAYGRNADGDVVMALSKEENEAFEVEDVEEMALLRGLQFTSNLGIQNLIINSDNLLLVEEVNIADESNAMYRNIIAEAKRLMNTFPICILEHYSRLTNGAAHRLARHSWNIKDVQIWWRNCPDFIVNVVYHDKQFL